MFDVGVTPSLNGKVRFLLGNEVMDRFKVMFDWDKRSLKPKEQKP